MSFLWGFGILQQCWGTLQEHSIPSNEPNAGNEQPMVHRNRTNCKLGVPRCEKPSVSLSLVTALPKLLMRKNAKWHIIRSHHNYCSQHTPTKCNLALLRCLSCGVLGSCSNVGGPCRNIQSHQMNPMLEMSNQWCTGTVLIVSWGSPGVKSLAFHYLWSLLYPNF